MFEHFLYDLSMGKNKSGQAVIEYLFVFLMFSALAVGAAKSIASFSGTFFYNFTYHLNQELSVGNCPFVEQQSCWHGNVYQNTEN